MLHYIKIKNLFGLYSYKLDSLFTKESPIRFITGPNGFGKSTILSMLSHLLQCDFDYFRNIHFEEFEVRFDQKLISIEKIDSLNNHIDDIPKEKAYEEKKIFISLINLSQKASEASFFIDSHGKVDSIIDKDEVEMFLIGEPHYFIRDQRLQRINMLEDDTDKLNNVNRNAFLFKELLNTCKERVSSIMSIQNFNLFDTTISEIEYNRRKSVINSDFEKLSVYGLAGNGFDLPKYQEVASNLMGVFLNLAENAIRYAKPLLEKIDLLKEIIESSEFADKEFQISPDFGYRFVSKNADRTLLDGSDLSSGEQHILIQAYELLFNAPEGSLALIDEPEMSFHMIWQMDYLKNLTKIAKHKNLQCIVATHSPQIFDSMWDLTYDLFELTHPKIEE